jgi:hypothetical protein
MLWLFVAVIVAGTISTFTDGLFMGVLFHARYFRYPEVWWPRGPGQGSARQIIYSSALAYVTAATVVVLCAMVHAQTISECVLVASLMGIGGPVVVSITTGFWVKIDPLVTAAHCAGYFARFLISGVAAGVALSVS